MVAQSLQVKRRPKTNESLAYPKVLAFLNSIKKRSLKTSRSYSSALIHLDNFIKKQYPDGSYNSDNIVDAMAENKINVYELLDNFVSYIQSVKVGISSKSIVAYMAGLRSYLGYHDIDIIPTKFKKKVFVPVVYREDEEPIDSSDIRKLLLSCNSKRLKPYLLCLASGGMRTVEALAIRNKDIDFSQSPTKIHIRKEYTKTKVARDIYISDEATYHLKQWLDWKYKNPEQPRAFDNDDLVFTVYRSANIPESLYQQICREFQRLLKTVGMDERKDTGIYKRHKITLHSFRRHCKGVIATQTNSDYSEWFLGHLHSPYWTLKEAERRETYKNKCMTALTFLDYSHLEATGKSIEAKLEEKDREIAYLRQDNKENKDAYSQLSDMVMKMRTELQELKEQRK